MTSIDQDIRKRRKLSLSTNSKKTPTRLKGGSLRSGSTFKQPTPLQSSHSSPLVKKSLRKVVKNVESSDDSSLEIGWDNNSPSPSTCTKPGRRKGNISALLKKFPMKKRIIEEGEDSAALKSWMQNNLAVTEPLADKPMKTTCRKSRTRSQRRGSISTKKTFNDQLKTFIENIAHSGESNNGSPCESTPLRRSPCIVGGEMCDTVLPTATPNESPIHHPLPPSAMQTPLLVTKLKTRPLYESPRTRPLYESPVDLKTQPIYESPGDLPDQFDDINWSEIHTQDFTSCTDNQVTGKVSDMCAEKCIKDAPLCKDTTAQSKGLQYRTRSPLKTSAADDSKVNNSASRMSSCRTLYANRKDICSSSSMFYTACDSSDRNIPSSKTNTCTVPSTSAKISQKTDPSSAKISQKKDSTSEKISQNAAVSFKTASDSIPCYTSRTDYIHGNTLLPSNNSLMNIDFDDLVEGKTLKTVAASNMVKTNVAPSNMVNTNMTLSNMVKTNVAPSNMVKTNVAPSNNLLKTKMLPSNNSLMNIDFDDDLDEILSSQDLDLSCIEKEKEKEQVLQSTTNLLQDYVINNQSDIIDISDDEDPIHRNEVKDVGMLLDDDFSILLDIDTNKNKNNCIPNGNTYLLRKTETVVDKLPNSGSTDSCKVSNPASTGSCSKVAKPGSCKVAKPPLLASDIEDHIRVNDYVDFDFDDADDLFDDLLMSLDGDVKCRSQETPVNITPEQRKLKSRCNTSPYPVSSKSNLFAKTNTTRNSENSNTIPANIKCKNDSILPTAIGKTIPANLSPSTMDGMSLLTLDSGVNTVQNNNFKTSNPRLNLKMPLKEVDNKQLQTYTNTAEVSKENVICRKNTSNSASSKTVNGYFFQKPSTSTSNNNATNKPSNAGNGKNLADNVGRTVNNNGKVLSGSSSSAKDISNHGNIVCISDNIPFDLSGIGTNKIEEEEENTTTHCWLNAVAQPSVISSTQKHVNTFLSSQKCSMDQIQRKRAEAQLKLKQKKQMKR